jgi:hypothetical protein
MSRPTDETRCWSHSGAAAGRRAVDPRRSRVFQDIDPPHRHGRGAQPRRRLHHSSKEDLLFETTLQRDRNASASSDTPSAQLAAVTRAFAGHHAEVPLSARVVNYQLEALNDEHLAEIRALRRLIGAEIRDIVDRGVACGEFATPHPQVAANAILSLGIDVGRSYATSGEWTPGDVGD